MNEMTENNSRCQKVGFSDPIPYKISQKSNKLILLT